MAIVSFKDRRLSLLLEDEHPGKGFPSDLIKVTQRKLEMINAAARVEDLRRPAGNRLKSLSGDLSGLWSIRINDQFRLVFNWAEGGPEDVDFVDYH